MPEPRSGAFVRLAVLALAVVLVGLPVDHLCGYGLLMAAALFTFTGLVRTRPRAWIAAGLIVALGIAGKAWLKPPGIEEGHNIFLPLHAQALQRGLPHAVYDEMARAFDAQYPPARRCDPETPWCWRADGLFYYLQMREMDGDFPTYRRCLETAPDCPHGFPVRTFAFSADAIFQAPRYSRQVTSIDFADPAWLRLGFVNDGAYNWWSANSDVHRAEQESWRHGLRRWRITMPWFVMYRFPLAYAGGSLCWRGDVMWEAKDSRFDLLHHPVEACRTLTAADGDKRIFGLAIKPDSLAMRLDAPWQVRLADAARTAIDIAGVIAILALLVVPRWRQMLVPAASIAAVLIMVAAFDVTMIGGYAAQEGGNDGLFYEAAARVMLQHLAAGDVMAALRGTEPVFYFGGPGLRYLRVVERIVFGDTNFGYLGLLLIFPLVAWGVFRRFLGPRWAAAMTLVFVLTPLGAYFGSTFLLYVKFALQGFGDPASYFFFLAGLVILVRRPVADLQDRFGTAAAAALCLALAVFVRPIVAPAVAVLLCGAGLFALWHRQWSRLAGLCVGFVPTLFMPWHNWYFGNRLVLFSANIDGNNLHISPLGYLKAVGELLRLDLHGQYLLWAVYQLRDFPVGFIGQREVSGLLGQMLSWPVHLAALAIVVHIALRGRTFDPWLRLVAGATLAQHGVALFYGGGGRYFFLSWLLTMLVAAAWFEREGMAWIARSWPTRYERIRGSAAMRWLAARLDVLEARLRLRTA